MLFLFFCYFHLLIINKSSIDWEIPYKTIIAKILFYLKASPNDKEIIGYLFIYCVFSKLLKELMLIRMLKFFGKYNLLSNNQLSFLTSHLTLVP